MASKPVKRTQADDTQLIEAVRQSVERIWQAGLGAFAQAQHEGEEMFTRLVQEGIEVQKRTQHAAEGRLEEMTDTITKMAENLGKQASAPLGKLEAAFEDRITRSLHSIGVPTRDDIEALSNQLGKLQKTVDAALGVKPAKGTQKSASSATGRKAATSSTNGARTGGKRSTTGATHRA
jgi:poly(hydroxyalkanoate) granule-associated protein